MRNGDFVPSRLQVQDDAVNAVCRMKTRQNVENSVGLLTLAELVFQLLAIYSLVLLKQCSGQGDPHQ